MLELAHARRKTADVITVDVEDLGIAELTISMPALATAVMRVKMDIYQRILQKSNLGLNFEQDWFNVVYKNALQRIFLYTDLREAPRRCITVAFKLIEEVFKENFDLTQKESNELRTHTLIAVKNSANEIEFGVEELQSSIYEAKAAKIQELIQEETNPDLAFELDLHNLVFRSFRLTKWATSIYVDLQRAEMDALPLGSFQKRGFELVEASKALLQILTKESFKSEEEKKTQKMLMAALEENNAAIEKLIHFVNPSSLVDSLANKILDKVKQVDLRSDVVLEEILYVIALELKSYLIWHNLPKKQRVPAYQLLLEKTRKIASYLIFGESDLYAVVKNNPELVEIALAVNQSIYRYKLSLASTESIAPIES